MIKSAPVRRTRQYPVNSQLRGSCRDLAFDVVVDRVFSTAAQMRWTLLSTATRSTVPRTVTLYSTEVSKTCPKALS